MGIFENNWFDIFDIMIVNIFKSWMRPSPFGNKLKKGLKRSHLPSKKEEGGEDNEGREG